MTNFQIPGSIPVYSAYGEPVNEFRPSNKTDGAEPSVIGMPYTGRGKCVANDDTCNAPKAKGTDYCYGHLRGLGQV